MIQTPKRVKGFGVLLYRLDNQPVTLEDLELDPDDYMQVGGKFNLSEWNGPFEFYDTFTREFSGTPRIIDRYDIVRFEYISPRRLVIDYLLVDLKKDKHLMFKGCHLLHKTTHPHALLRLPTG